MAQQGVVVPGVFSFFVELRLGREAFFHFGQGEVFAFDCKAFAPAGVAVRDFDAAF